MLTVLIFSVNGAVIFAVARAGVLKVYGDNIVGPVSRFPDQMEQRITRYTTEPELVAVVADTDSPATAPAAAPIAPAALRPGAAPAELEWLRRNSRVPN